MKFPLGRAGELTVAVPGEGGADRLVGVRTNDVEAAGEIRERLGPWVTDAEPPGFPNVSLLFGAEHDGRRDAHGVYRRGIQVFHSFDRDAVIESTVRVVQTFRPAPPGLVVVQGRVLERDGRAVLVGADFATIIDAHHRRLYRAGFRPVPYAPLLVDPARAEVLVTTGDALDAPPVDRLPIAHVVAQAPRPEPDAPDSVGLVQLQTLVTAPRAQLHSADLRGLAELVARAPVVRLDTWEARDVVDAIVAL